MSVGQLSTINILRRVCLELKPVLRKKKKKKVNKKIKIVLLTSSQFHRFHRRAKVLCKKKLIELPLFYIGQGRKCLAQNHAANLL